MPERILTTWDACRIADIVRAAQGNRPVTRLVNDQVISGIARSIGDENGNLSQATDDVRDLFLRVTSTHGWEHFWRVSELMEELVDGAFATNYPQP